MAMAVDCPCENKKQASDECNNYANATISHQPSAGEMSEGLECWNDRVLEKDEEWRDLRGQIDALRTKKAASQKRLRKLLHNASGSLLLVEVD